MTNMTRIFDLLDQYRQQYIGKTDALLHKENGEWKKFSASDYVSIVDQVSTGLLSLGIKKGDTVATILNNSPFWNFFDMGLMQIGAIQVPVYPTISADNFKYIFNEAEVKLIVVSNMDIYSRIQGVLKDVPTLKDVYSIDAIDGLRNWKELLTTGTEEDYALLKQIKQGILPGDLATIIYTSGTTGRPKGVMLSHWNFITNFLALSEILKDNMVDHALSFLPLCHVYERILNYMYQNNGITIHYAESIDKLGDYIREVHPEIFCAVPRVIEKSFNRIMAKGRDLKGLKRLIFFWAVNLGYKYELNNANGWWYHFKLKIADRLVFSKWRQGLGGKLDTIVSGGATLQMRLAKVFRAAGIKVMEGYGLTETSPVIAVSNFKPDGVKFGTVGYPLPGVEVRIAFDGEILCKGPNIMLGYFKHPDETKKVIDTDGWFHTGDIGAFEDGRYLKITDRKKEMYKTSGGKYVAPQVVENKFKESPFIENVLVIGENRHFTSAILIPNFEHLRSWCRVKEITYTTDSDAIHNQRIIARIQREVDETNEKLDKTEQVKKFELLDKPWTVEDGDLSPTLKLRRNYLEGKYRDLIERMYASAGE
ncbi:MAG: long-chain fatty acid--CoA ligase [Bacteroidetes bacterium]|nr:long-chain fatty acid--CoA ligase [Bacteroidota bacterium]